jgi:hypothetical protein
MSETASVSKAWHELRYTPYEPIRFIKTMRFGKYTVIYLRAIARDSNDIYLLRVFYDPEKNKIIKINKERLGWS